MTVNLSIFAPFDKDAFRDLVQSLVVPETIGVWWQGDPQRFPGPAKGKPGAYLELDVTEMRDLGYEDVKQVWDPNTSALSITYSKAVVYSIEFYIKSFSFDYPAYNVLSNLLLKFRRSTTSDQLQAFNQPLAYALNHGIMVTDEVADNRPIYGAKMELEFNGIVTESDDSDEGGIIEQINGGPATGPGAPGPVPGTFTGS